MSHVCLCLTETQKERFERFLSLFFIRKTAQKNSRIFCVPPYLSYAFTDVFADAGALLPNGTTTGGGFSVAFEAKEGGRAIVVVSFTRGRR